MKVVALYSIKGGLGKPLVRLIWRIYLPVKVSAL